MKNQETITEVTDTATGEYRTYAKAGSPEAEEATLILYPSQLSVRIGSLEIRRNVEDPTSAVPVVGSEVLIDGKSFPVKSIILSGAVDGVWVAELVYYPNRRQPA